MGGWVGEIIFVGRKTHPPTRPSTYLNQRKKSTLRWKNTGPTRAARLPSPRTISHSVSSLLDKVVGGRWVGGWVGG